MCAIKIVSAAGLWFGSAVCSHSLGRHDLLVEWSIDTRGEMCTRDEQDSNRLWWPRRSSLAPPTCQSLSNNNKPAMESKSAQQQQQHQQHHPQRMLPSSTLLTRVFKVLLLLSCSPVGSITAHGANVAGSKASVIIAMPSRGAAGCAADDIVAVATNSSNSGGVFPWPISGVICIAYLIRLS